MKIGKIHKLIKKYLDKEWGKLDFKYEQDGDTVTVVNDLTLTKCGVELNVLMEIFFTESGLAAFDVTFDKIDETIEALQLINEFNGEMAFFKAHITEKGYFRLSRYVEIFEEDNVAPCLHTFFYFLLDDKMEEALEGIIPLLHE